MAGTSTIPPQNYCSTDRVSAPGPPGMLPLPNGDPAVARAPRAQGQREDAASRERGGLGGLSPDAEAERWAGDRQPALVRTTLGGKPVDHPQRHGPGLPRGGLRSCPQAERASKSRPAPPRAMARSPPRAQQLRRAGSRNRMARAGPSHGAPPDHPLGCASWPLGRRTRLPTSSIAMLAWEGGHRRWPQRPRSRRLRCCCRRWRRAADARGVGERITTCLRAGLAGSI